MLRFRYIALCTWSCYFLLFCSIIFFFENYSSLVQRPLLNPRVKLSSVALSMTVWDHFYFLNTLIIKIWSNFWGSFGKKCMKKKIKSIFDLAHIWLHRKLFGLFSTLHSSLVSLSFLHTSWAVSGQGIWHLQPEHKIQK